jgi:hypothetical protein
MLKKGFDCAQNLLRIYFNPTEESLMPTESERKSGLMGVGWMIPGLRRTACVLGISLSLLMVMVGCGGGSATTSTPPAVAVSITTPTSAQTVPVNGTLAITAAVANTTNTAVTWTVNGVTNGNSTYGTIAGSGLSVTYTAPAAVPATATFNITATSQEDNTKAASVSVTISAGVVVSMTTPSGPQNVLVSSTLGITASVTGTSNTGVTWTVNGIANGNSTYGTISGTGLTVTYTAPAAVPSPATFNVTATSVVDTTKSASVSVTILPLVGVSITTPTGAQSLEVNATLGITASVTGTSNTGVTWTVNGITNGNSTYGTISGSGLSVTYTAPAAVPSPATFNVTATSVADNTKSASVSVTITAAPAVAVSITSPTNLTQSVVVNGTLAITAAVANTSNTAVTWTVNGITNGNSTYGTISGSGLSVTYNAPAAVPSPATFNVTATSVADTTKSASVSVTITVAAAVAVSITSPTDLTQSVVADGTLAITAAVANTSNTAVTWTVNGITSGNSTYGTIAGSGLSVTYDAPAAVPSPATFNVTVTSVADTTKSASVSVTITAAAAACGTGNEKVLNGQYAFTLTGFNSSGFQAAIGSFTADGAGHITAGMVDSNGVSPGVNSGSITASSSSYSVGSDNRGCATIATSFYTYTTRFALVPTSSVAAAGSVEEWESGSSPFIASGQIFLQNVPSEFPSGTFVLQFSGIDDVTHQYRAAAVGAGTGSGGQFTNGEFDLNVESVHKVHTGAKGGYSGLDPTTGRLTVTGLAGSATVAAYLVSSTYFIAIIEDTLSTNTFIATGSGQVQSSSFTLTTGQNLVFYATGLENVEFAVVTITSSSTLTANIYHDVEGSWTSPSPSTATCDYTIDTFARVVTSGADCGLYFNGTSWSYPPVFYLTGNDTGVMLGTDDPGVLLGQLAPQSATSITAGTYYIGTQEVVSQSVDETLTGEATITSSGSLTGTGDSTSVSAVENGGLPISATLTVNADGTFSTSNNPGVVIGVIISGSQLIQVDGQGSTFPTILIINAVPGS